LLAPLYSWFTEGFDTADLQEAKALLGDETMDASRTERGSEHRGSSLVSFMRSASLG
jgi:hypothetical protein